MKFIVENEIIINGTKYIYIIESKKVKNIYFRVKEDLKIHVSCPKSVSKNYIENLLIQNEKAIIKMTNNMKNKNEKAEKITYLGNELKLVNTSGKPYISNEYIYAKDFLSAKEYIYSVAYSIFLERVNALKGEFNNLPEFTLKVRKMTSKWGVCNKRSMTVTLNTYLIEKDVHLIDYVIVHELCHFKYMDHSANFWNYVSSFYPYYKLARKELNHD